MKRDMDLVRQLLIRTEEAECTLDTPTLSFDTDEYDLETIVYHVRLLEAHGLIDANISRDITGSYHCTIQGLTWDGCDYLDAIRDTRVWERTKKLVASTVGSTTMSVIKTAAIEVAKTLIKSAL